MLDCDLELAIVLSGVATRPVSYLGGGGSVSHLVAYLDGYSRAQLDLMAAGGRTLLEEELLGGFGDWLVVEHSAEGSSWHWRICSLDSGERNAELMLRLFRDYLAAIDKPIGRHVADDYSAAKISMAQAKMVVRASWAERSK